MWGNSEGTGVAPVEDLTSQGGFTPTDLPPDNQLHPADQTPLPPLLLPQEKVSSAAPPGWSIELVDMSFGTDAPKTSNYRVSSTWGSTRCMSLQCLHWLAVHEQYMVGTTGEAVGPFGGVYANGEIPMTRGSFAISMLLLVPSPASAAVRCSMTCPVAA